MKMPATASDWERQWPILLAGEPWTGEQLAAAPWAAIIDAADSHGLLGALAARLRRSGCWDAAPDGERQRMKEACTRASVAMLAKRAASDVALDALAGVGIVPVGYKGIALANLVYPDPAMRSMCDVDLWLPEGRMDDAVAALGSAGFVYRPSRESRSAEWQAAFSGEVKMQHPHLGLVELHYDIFPGEWLQRATSIDREAIRSRLIAAQVDGRSLRVLAPRDHLIQVALHAAISNRHSIAGLRGLLDVVLLAERVDDWDALAADAARWRVRRVVAHVLALSGILFQQATLQDVSRRLADGLPLDWLNRHMDASALLRHRKLLGPMGRWSFLLCSTDRFRDAMGLLRHTLWPDTGWLGLRYGDARASRRFEHLVNVARGQV